jgi:hypothetical protein
VNADNSCFFTVNEGVLSSNDLQANMKRRNLILAFGGAVAAWSAASLAQQLTVPVIGFLSPRSPDESAHLVTAFRRGLGEAGLTEGQNASVEYHWALGEYANLSMLATELVRGQIDVLVAVSGEPAVLTAKAAISTIPIVAVFVGDPVESGLIASLRRPRGNVTGISGIDASLEAKRLGLLHELVQRATTLAPEPQLSGSGATVEGCAGGGTLSRRAASDFLTHAPIPKSMRPLKRSHEQHIRGLVVAAYDAASKKLSWKVTYSGLSGPATAAHFHGPAEAGKNVRYCDCNPEHRHKPCRGQRYADRRTGCRPDVGQILCQHPHRGQPGWRNSRSGEQVSSGLGGLVLTGRAGRIAPAFHFVRHSMQFKKVLPLDSGRRRLFAAG